MGHGKSLSKKTYRGSYSIAVLIDQEAQMYAVETGQSSIGGLDAILSNLPDGFGSSVYQEGNYLGILIRNDFENTDELLLQFKQLRSEEILLYYCYQFKKFNLMIVDVILELLASCRNFCNR